MRIGRVMLISCSCQDILALQARLPGSLCPWFSVGAGSIACSLRTATKPTNTFPLKMTSPPTPSQQKLPVIWYHTRGIIYQRGGGTCFRRGERYQYPEEAQLAIPSRRNRHQLVYVFMNRLARSKHHPKP